MQYALVIEEAMRGGMRIGSMILLVLIVLFFLLPILAGRAPVPGDIRAHEIGLFIGGIIGYWLDVLRTVFAAV